MSHPRRPQPVKLVMSFIYADAEALNQILRLTCGQYGPIDFLSEPFPFDFTNYYEPEMGKPLERRIASFEDLIDPGDLAGIKHWTNQLEDRFRNDHRGRKVNIDPGYIGASKFILATGKDYSHRIYLGDGIYGDLTLRVQEGGFHPLPWTYPDYAGEPLRKVLNLLRKKYLWQLKNRRGGETSEASRILEKAEGPLQGEKGGTFGAAGISNLNIERGLDG